MKKQHMMTATEAITGGAEAQARSAAREALDALVAQVVAKYDIIPGAEQFNFVAKDGGLENLAHTSPVITSAGEMEIVCRTRRGCTMPERAFVEYTSRRLYANFCKRMKAEEHTRQEATGILTAAQVYAKTGLPANLLGLAVEARA